MMPGIMSQDRYSRFFKQHHKAPSCVSCQTKIHIDEPIEPIRGHHQVKYLCGNCKDKDVVVFQYPKSQPANKVGEKLAKCETCSNLGNKTQRCLEQQTPSNCTKYAGKMGEWLLC